MGAFSHTTGWAIPNPVIIGLTVAYGLKEAAAKIADGLRAGRTP